MSVFHATTIQQARFGYGYSCLPPEDDAPDHTSTRLMTGVDRVEGAVVTISAPAEAILATIERPELLAQLLDEGMAIEPLSADRELWTVIWRRKPIPLALNFRREPEAGGITWSSDGGGGTLKIRLRLRPAPSARGTVAELMVSWKPAFGLGSVVAARLRRERPKMLCSRVLRRLKMLIETGEIARSGPPGPLQKPVPGLGSEPVSCGR